jgi:hypothetical protein
MQHIPGAPFNGWFRCSVHALLDNGRHYAQDNHQVDSLPTKTSRSIINSVRTVKKPHRLAMDIPTDSEWHGISVNIQGNLALSAWIDVGLCTAITLLALFIAYLAVRCLQRYKLILQPSPTIPALEPMVPPGEIDYRYQ